MRTSQNTLLCERTPQNPSKPFWELIRTHENPSERFHNDSECMEMAWNTPERWKMRQNLQEPFRITKTHENASQHSGTFITTQTNDNVSECFWTPQSTPRTSEKVTEPLGTFHNHSVPIRTSQNTSGHLWTPQTSENISGLSGVIQNKLKHMRTL